MDVFFIEDDNLFKKYIILFGIKSALVEKDFCSQHVYNRYNFENQNKIHGYEVTDFHNKEIPKMDSNHNCLAVISLDSVLKNDKNYYLQVFLKECKYVEKNVIKDINEYTEICSDDSDKGLTGVSKFFKERNIKHVLLEREKGMMCFCKLPSRLPVRKHKQVSK